MKQRILVVDDNDDFRNILSMSLRSKGFEITQANSGREAAVSIAENSYDLILSDIEMPDLNGIQLLAILNTTKCTTPVLLMTGHEPMGYLDEAKKHGVAGFLLKPFSTQFLVDRIEKILQGYRPAASSAPGAGTAGPAAQPAGEAKPTPQVQAPVMEIQRDDLQTVGIEDFFIGRALELDLFIVDKQGKVRRIGEGRKEMDPHLQTAARTGRFGEIYAQRSDYELIIQRHLNINGNSGRAAMSSGPAATVERQKELQKRLREAELPGLRVDGPDPLLFKMAWSLTETCAVALSKQMGLGAVVDDWLDSDDQSLRHVLGVAVYGLLIAYHLGWRSPATLYKVVMGALLHDVGLLLVPRQIRSQSVRSLGSSERAEYERHPIIGVGLLKDVGLINEEVLQIVAQHHENRIGTGFPAGLRENAIFPLARLVALANEFSDLVLGARGADRRSASEAWKVVNGALKPCFSTQMLQALGDAIGIPKDSAPGGAKAGKRVLV